MRGDAATGGDRRAWLSNAPANRAPFRDGTRPIIYGRAELGGERRVVETSGDAGSQVNGREIVAIDRPAVYQNDGDHHRIDDMRAAEAVGVRLRRWNRLVGGRGLRQLFCFTQLRHEQIDRRPRQQDADEEAHDDVAPEDLHPARIRDSAQDCKRASGARMRPAPVHGSPNVRCRRSPSRYSVEERKKPDVVSVIFTLPAPGFSQNHP